MHGLCCEIQTEDGLLWNIRIRLMDTGTSSFGDKDAAEYGLSPQAAESQRTESRIIEILGVLHEQLSRNKEATGSAYFVGSSLTVLDLMWACYSLMLTGGTASDELLEKTKAWPVPNLAVGKGICTESMRQAVTPLLVQNRDHVFQTHLSLPLQLTS